MRMVATSRFRYSAPLVPWTEAELDKLDTKWLQIQRKAWKLPPGYPSAPLAFPSACGGCAEMHPLVPMIQALAKHVEQLVALPDELRETAICKYKRLCVKFMTAMVVTMSTSWQHVWQQSGGRVQTR